VATALDHDACLAKLAAARFGRLVVVAEGRPEIFPVSMRWKDDRVVFRTDPGLKAKAAGLAHVAFEIDHVDFKRRTGWSVVVHGPCTEITDAVDAASALLRAASIDLLDEGPKHCWFAVLPERITGRTIAATD
jgi:nitroimidazol reductase NimA-like FMN-containing flavoprotein (pyridoxamine 5'-phosphate oxidase superfamily)